MPFSRHALGLLLERLHLRAPERLHVGEPGLQVGQRLGLQLIGAGARVVVGAARADLMDDAGLPKHAQVAAHGLARHRECVGDLARAVRAVAQQADDRAPRGLGERLQRAVEGVAVDDADAHCAQARARGATITSEPSTHDYGDDYWSDRSYGASDCEGHAWWFMHRIRDQPAK